MAMRFLHRRFPELLVREAVAFDVLLENPDRRGKLFGGDGPLAFGLTIWVVLEHNPAAFQLFCKACEASGASDFVRGGFK
ncbi:hypothetical protein [Novosphingobium naphthalenivorans]|uniref:hypothetical protein n=1 Tax=Novosphingobium naphthalenivorans TaxID=273168 RepID=UPI0008320B24|nr:hypothetical protein [Novosphingobium naphthalenivorans]